MSENQIEIFGTVGLALIVAGILGIFGWPYALIGAGLVIFGESNLIQMAFKKKVIS